MKDKERKIIKIINLIFAIFLVFYFAACVQNHQNQLSNDPRIIKTYNSPAAYYGKPLSRIYANPYDLNSTYSDNDRYYIPPMQYGAENYYDPRRYRSQKY